jgi:hypothetical protein
MISHSLSNSDCCNSENGDVNCWRIYCSSIIHCKIGPHNLLKASALPEMANRTNKPNRTFSRSCSVCLSSTPHRTEPNSVLVQFVFSRFSNMFGSVQIEHKPNSTLVWFGFCKFKLCQVNFQSRGKIEIV